MNHIVRTTAVMKSFSVALLLFLFSVIMAYGQELKLTGFHNYTNWVDKHKDNTVNAKELENLDAFVPNEQGNFSFLVFLPSSTSFFTAKENRVTSQNFVITAKDNDSGEEWNVYEAAINPREIKWFELIPIRGNITLTCRFSELDSIRTLSYSYLSASKEEDQQMNHPLSREEIQRFSKLNEEKKTDIREAKSVRVMVAQNWDCFRYFYLPVAKTAKRLLAFTGLDTTETDHPSGDLQIIINITGNSKVGTVKRQAPHSKSISSVEVRTEIGIDGTILFKPATKTYFANDFAWHKKIYPLEFVVGPGGGTWVQNSNQLTIGYRNMFYQDSFLGVFGPMLIEAFNLDPVNFYLYAAEDKNSAMSYNAIKLLGELHDTTAFLPLVHIYQTDSIWNRRAAISALGELQDSRTFQTLVEALDDSDGGIRYRAAEGLGKLGDQRAVKPLIMAIDKASPNTLHRIIKALGELGDPAAVEPIIPLLKKSRFKKDAREALVQLTGEDKGEKYKDWKTWWEEQTLFLL